MSNLSDNILCHKSNSIDEKTKEISNFSFPFINTEFHSSMLDDLKEATESLISDANDYLKYLTVIEKN